MGRRALLIARDCSRRGPVQLQLRAYFLDLRCLLFELPSQFRHSGFQCLHFEIEHRLLGGIGNGLGPDAFGRKTTRVGSRGGEGAQSSIGINQHEFGRPGGNRRTRDIVDKAPVAYLAENTVHTRVVADDDIVIGGRDTLPGQSAYAHVIARAYAAIER